MVDCEEIVKTDFSCTDSNIVSVREVTSRIRGGASKKIVNPTTGICVPLVMQGEDFAPRVDLDVNTDQLLQFASLQNIEDFYGMDCSKVFDKYCVL